MIFGHYYTVWELDELSKLANEVIAKFGRSIKALVYKYSDGLKHLVKYSSGL